MFYGLGLSVCVLDMQSDERSNPCGQCLHLRELVLPLHLVRWDGRQKTSAHHLTFVG